MLQLQFIRENKERVIRGLESETSGRKPQISSMRR